ncbi:MAG: hypothetical protein JSW11_05325 [Candidatus Heimdallarchaeota archaeon]|nr:MAG: hypothetical protein JSW11_05325 [Candidatus Heimdallarchaeota archaeon]
MSRVLGNYSYKLFLMSVFLVLILSAFSPTTAAPIATSTTILSDVGAVGPGGTIQFTVWVYADFDPVPTGPIRITHLNDTDEYIDTTILAGKVIVNWTVNSYSEGVHVFQAAFQGFLDYSSSSGICSVNFDDFSPGSSKTTIISLSSNSTVVYKNSSIQFSVDLEIIGELHPHFRGGYIYVKNTNLSGSPTIYSHGPLPLHISAVYSFSFDYQIPTFSSIGVNSFITEYTGSSESQTKPCTSSLHNITVLSTGYLLVQNLDHSSLQREERTLELNTTVLGDNPVGLELKTYYILNEEEIIIQDQILESRNTVSHFSPNSSVPTGILSIITELIDPSTELQYANATENVSIIDRARIDHSENATEYRHNETIRFDVYVTEEDVWTHPVVSEVELIDVTDNNRSVINKTTNQDGFVIIEYTIPGNSTVGNHDFSLKTHDSGSFIADISETFPIVIKGLTEFDLTYESGGVERNSITIIEVTVLSGGNPISEGFVTLEFASNSTVIETQACEPGLEFHYFIKTSHPRGDMDYQVHFFGSTNYDEHLESFVLSIFSNPIFNTTGQNATNVIKGHTVRIWGQLVDESSQILANEEVQLTDTSTGIFLGTSITDAQGIFVYDYYISDSTQIGLHFVEIAYTGNPLEFYHSAVNTPVLSFTVRPPLSILIDTEVVAEYWTIIVLEGGLNDEILLEWQKEGESDWENLGVIILNSTGQGSYNWTTPYYKGAFTIRAIGPNGTKYDVSSMFAIPKIVVEGDEIGNVNDPYPFTVNSSEQYQIWIGDQLWQDWRAGGVHEYEYTFTNRGIKELLIISNNSYVYYQEYRHSLLVFEDVFITLSAPLEALVNITVNLDGTVIGEVSGPIQAMDVILEVNGTEVQVDSTDGAGNYYFSLIFDVPGHYNLMTKTPLSATDFYIASFSDVSIISIRSNPADIQILNPLNRTYRAIVEISLTGNAESYWYRIAPIDSKNLSWSAPIFRELVEGNYTCHFYGQNAFGVITYAYSNFGVDTTAPSLVLVNPENITYTTDEILLSYLSDEDEVLIFLDGVELEDISSGSLLFDLAEGDHNLTIMTTDEVGNNIKRVALFSVDTIPPSLEIFSPYNQSYISEIEIRLGSNGSTVLYYISSVYSYNQTYSEPFWLNLSIGNYQLVVHAFDDAGNVHTESVFFSIVQTIDLLVGPNYEVLDGAGTYLIYTEILNHPNFDCVGVNLNGSFEGCLEWSYLYLDYRLTIQFETPGIWEVTLFANTTLQEYDFHYFEIEWNPPPPSFETISISHTSSSFDVRVHIDSGSLSLENIKVLYNGSFYDLTESYGNRWEGSLPFIPHNTTIVFSAWYPWSLTTPAAQQEYDIHWYAPVISVEYVPSRTDFTLQLQIMKQNATIDTSSVTLIISNGSFQITVNETSFYEDLTRSYQEWEFISPTLFPSLWHFSVNVTDIYGVTRIFTGLFNATDTPPVFGNKSMVLENSHKQGEMWCLEIGVTDDYEIDGVFLFVDGIKLVPSTQNDTHFTFDIWLDEGIHNLQVVAVDDIGQENTLILPSIEVTLYHSSVSRSSPEDIITSEGSSHSNLAEDNKRNGDLDEISLAGSIFAGLIIVGNVINRKRRG